jgi:hypothetical protein
MLRLRGSPQGCAAVNEPVGNFAWPLLSVRGIAILSPIGTHTF